jgi:hypothetical protein
MGDGARRDRDIGKNEEIREPEPAADGGGVLDRFFDLLEIVGLGGDGGQTRRRRRGRGLVLGPPRRLCQPPCAQFWLLHPAPSSQRNLIRERCGLQAGGLLGARPSLADAPLARGALFRFRRGPGLSAALRRRVNRAGLLRPVGAKPVASVPLVHVAPPIGYQDSIARLT